ncbi:MAG: hypothetical protein D6772_10445, partial [Bacteroidetes bacterium]
MRYNYLLTILLMSVCLSAQNLRLELPRVDVADGASVTLPLTVANFDSIVSMQLSINWDTTVATYEAFSLAALPLLAIGDFQAEQGELRLSWFDNVGDGRTLDNGTVIANLSFRAAGNPGDFTDLRFTDTPLAIQVFRATSEEGVFTPVQLEPVDGRIRIEAPLGFTFTDLQAVTCAGAADGLVAVDLTEADTVDYELRWAGPNGFMATGFRQDNLSGGRYTLALVDRNGELVFTTEVTVAEAASLLELATPIVTNSDCNSPTGSIHLTASGGQPPYVFTARELSNETGVFDELAAGLYPLSVTDALGCTISSLVEVDALEAPELDLPAERQLCGEETLRIGADSPGDYTWSTGARTDSISINAPGTYSLTITNAAGCTAADSTVVTRSAPPVAVLENDFLEICPGDSLQLQVSGGDRYFWLEDASSLSAVDIAAPLAFPDTTTNYTLILSNECGTDTLTFELFVYTITATAGQDTCVAPGDMVLLEANSQ